MVQLFTTPFIPLPKDEQSGQIVSRDYVPYVEPEPEPPSPPSPPSQPDPPIPSTEPVVITRRSGRPRKFTGPEWDHLPDPEYKRKRNSERQQQFRENHQPRKIIAQTITLPINEAILFDTRKYSNSPTFGDLFREWQIACIKRNEFIANFVSELTKYNLYEEQVKAKVMAYKEIMDDAYNGILPKHPK